MTDKAKETKEEALVGVARKHVGDGSKITQLSTGYFARVRPISYQLLYDARSVVKEPEVPMWHNEDKGTDEPNPNHPEYLSAMEQYQVDQLRAMADIMIMFGVDLVNEDGSALHAPEDNEWIDRLNLRAKLGLTEADLGAFDMENQTERDFVFKRYYAIGSPDINKMVIATGMASEEDISKAEDSFRDN